MIAPHLTTRTLFAIDLGTSIDYAWTDLNDRLCATPEKRVALLREANVRWVLVRAPNASSRGAFDDYRWDCGLTLATLGATFPAAWSAQDLALYRLSNAQF